MVMGHSVHGDTSMHQLYVMRKVYAGPVSHCSCYIDRMIMLSSRKKCSTSRSHLDLGPTHLVFRLGLAKKGLGVLSWVSDFSSHQDVSCRHAMHDFSSLTQTSMP